MLFDLQTPRRRRVVRVVFGGLALIFAISFVFLGVGTGGGGFSFSDLFGGGSSSSSSTAFDSDIKAAQEKLVVNPNDTTTLRLPRPAPVLGGQRQHRQQRSADQLRRAAPAERPPTRGTST